MTTASSHTLGKNLIMLVFTIELVNESIWATDISAELPDSLAGSCLAVWQTVAWQFGTLNWAADGFKQVKSRKSKRAEDT